MCGILFALSSREIQEDPDTLELRNEISARGPDSLCSHYQDYGSAVRLEFTSSVLALRGHTVVKQPLVDQNIGVLCWNGQVFGGALDVGKDDNDTLSIWQQLKSGVPIARVLEQVEGP